jgi:hypothetical protein
MFIDPINVSVTGHLSRYVCVFITAVPITKLFAWGKGDSGGHVTSDLNRSFHALVCA